MTAELCLARLAALLLMVALPPAAQAANATAASADGTPLQWARTMVSNVAPDATSYQHKGGHVAWNGVNGATAYESHTDCSGFINALLEQSYGYDRKRFEAWLGKGRPLAITYHDAITSGNGFARISRAAAMAPGDIIAIRYPDGSENTGHVLLVAAAPTRRIASHPFVAGLDQWDVEVIDSSESGHGKQDTRRLPDGKFRQGVGEGTMRLYTDHSGTIAGYSWSTFANSDFYDPQTRDIVVGRLEASRAP
jgi:hypothetical protein